MKFPKGNKIRFGQDMRQHSGIPSDVQWQVEVTGNLLKLTGPGYGTKNNYGSGSIYVALPVADNTTDKPNVSKFQKPDKPDNREQKLVDIMFQLVMALDDPMNKEWAKTATREAKAAWVRVCLRGSGFSITEPIGSSWGELK